MNPQLMIADSVVSGNGSAHSLGTVLREALYVLSVFETNIRQQKRCGFGTLAASAVPSDFQCVFHFSPLF